MKRELLIKLRGKKSQAKLAKELGISQQFLSFIEIGKRTPNIKTMKNLEEYFDVPMQQLFPDVFMSSNTTKCDYSKNVEQKTETA